MIGNFQRVSQQQLEALLADPSGITATLYGYEDENEGVDEDRLHIDVDKAWHGIHFLLSGDAWEGTLPHGFIMAGEPIGDEDVGYGPARGLTASEVRRVAMALLAIDEPKLRSRFDSAAMMAAEIYPQIWDRDPDRDDTLGYLLEHFGVLQQFVKDAAEAGDAMPIYIN
ncbi:MAG: YfbM family protein [Kofleriaceae bacterium]|nr:YfbM family protein [Kofleriaceae bacterium]